jgi:hypothetical protein
MRRSLGVPALVVAGVAAVSSSPAADPPAPFGEQARVSHIAGALAAVAEATPAALKEGADYARVLERGACSAGAERLKAQCLRIAVERYCRDRPGDDAPRCALYMDVVVSNVLADPRLIPPEKRYTIIRTNVDYRPALADELRRIQGTLAVDFRLREGEGRDRPALAAEIDHYCLGDARPAAFSYPACVSSLVWFIAGPR